MPNAQFSILQLNTIPTLSKERLPDPKARLNTCILEKYPLQKRTHRADKPSTVHLPPNAT
jgi:hypothetical protein